MSLTNLTEFIVEKMKRELPHFVVYHSVDHTLDVHDAAERLAVLEGLNDSDIRLVRAAALFHDSGITVSFIDHEDISADLAGQYLPSFGFNLEEIERIQRMIVATKLPQTATTLEEKILCDADLDYLGRGDFFIIGQKLRLEWELSDRKVSLCDWYIIQMEFLRAHFYFTKSAQVLRNERKQKNLEEIEHLCTFSCNGNKNKHR
ncbi:MAG: phosphohydrolase [Bacteroidetes bacterium HGW-Bacteroidetes-9]|jgi:predicted metal-dependent HD superfamily phosphohydrolase|nr:MAG: phosphohydrolase [Bacteroidetes bacterium HGW-Bacteroidetes-9]